jgi:hypothetical protein
MSVPSLKSNYPVLKRKEAYFTAALPTPMETSDKGHRKSICKRVRHESSIYCCAIQHQARSKGNLGEKVRSGDESQEALSHQRYEQWLGRSRPYHGGIRSLQAMCITHLERNVLSVGLPPHADSPDTSVDILTGIVEERKRHNGGNEDGSMDCMPACGRKEWASWSVCFGGHLILSGLIGNQLTNA